MSEERAVVLRWPDLQQIETALETLLARQPCELPPAAVKRYTDWYENRCGKSSGQGVKLSWLTLSAGSGHSPVAFQ